MLTTEQLQRIREWSKDDESFEHIVQMVVNLQHKQQSLLQSIIDNSPAVIFAKDLQGRFILANQQFETFHQLDRGEIVGKTDSDFLPPEVAEQTRSFDREVLKSGTPTVREERIPGAERTHTYLANKFPLYDAGGLPYAVGGIATDITERKDTEDALRASEERYRSVVDNITDVIFQTDTDGRWTFLNRSWSDITGFGVEESLGQPFISFLHPDDRQRNTELFQPLVAREKESCRHEVRYLTRDGGYCWVEVYARLLLDADGAITGTAGVLKDITDYRHTLDALRESEARYRGLIESQVDMIVRVDPQGRFTFVNDVYCKTFGKSREELIGHTFVPLVHEDDVQATLDAMKQLEVPPYRIYIEQRALTASGWRWLAWEDYAIKDEHGTTTEIQAIGRDITDRKQAEESLLRRDAILEAVGFAAEQFLAVASIEESIQRVLERLGKATSVSRAYIFENLHDEEVGLYTSQRYEWAAPGVEPQIDNQDLQFVPYEAAGLDRWQTMMQQSQSLYGNVRDFPQGERDILEPQDIQSLAVVPIAVGQQWWGFMGFDDCVRERQWSVSEIDALKAAAGIMGAAIQRERVQEALRESEARYRSIITAMHEGIVLQGADGSIREWNSSAERVLGLTADQLQGRTSIDPRWKSVHEDGRPFPGEDHPAMVALRTGQPCSNVIMGVHKPDGSRSWLLVNSQPIFRDHRDHRDHATQPYAVVSTFSDITEQRLADAALRASEAQYRAIVEDQTELICRFQHDGTLTFVNEACCRYFHKTRDELIGLSFIDGIPLQDQQKVRASIAALTPDHPVETIEHRVIMDSGEQRWQQWTNRLIVDDQGRTSEFQGVGRDITDRVRAQEMLVRISAAVESTSDAVSIGEMSGNLIYHNRAFIDLYGYDAEQLNALGGPAAIFVDRTVGNQVLESAVQGRSWSGTAEFRARDGRIIPTLLRADIIVDSTGQQIGLIAVCTDVTMQKKVEQELIAARESALETSRLKSEFLANMSHEIRTPLNAIIGMTGLLLEMDLEPEPKEFAETIRNSGDSLLTIINDILDFSKIEAGRLELEYQPFDLRTCIEESFDLVTPQAAEKHLDLAYTLDEQVPPMLIGDVTRLRQVLVNLLSNAVKFTEEGEVVVAVNADACREGNEPESPHDTRFALHVQVKDTGIGIPADRMNRLFQSFSQVDSSVTRKYGGTGLGLAISNALVEAMGGTMWVESEPGVGSRFHFTIKVKAAPARLRSFQQHDQPQLAGKRVLIVDDNQTNRRILMRQLQSWGMTPRATPSGLEALEWLRWGEPFDLAILDMHMPEMDGLTLAHEIRHHRPEHALPMMMLSSVGGMRGAGQQQHDTLFVASLSKPVKPSQLHNVLMNIFTGDMCAFDFDDESHISPLDPNMGTLHPLRILVAEDHAVNQKVALRLLKRLGYRADVAANGIEVIEALQRQSYDVILMDVQMPELDGEETTRRIRATLPPARQPRIIAVTAHALKGSRERYMNAGMDNYISKPVRLEELALVLESCEPTGDIAHHEKQLPPVAATPATPATPATSATPAFDQEVFQELMDDADAEERKEIREIITLFLDSTPELIQELHEATTHNDPPSLRTASHTLKSSSQMGATHLATLAAQVQEIADTGTVEGAAPLIAAIETAYQRVKTSLETVLHDLHTQDQIQAQAQEQEQEQEPEQHDPC